MPQLVPPVPSSLRPLLDTSASGIRAASGASGPFWIPPAGVLRPRSEEDVAALLSWASSEAVPLVPRGAGTGMPAGNVGPFLVLDLSGLRDSLRVDPEARTVTGSAGVIAAEAAEAATAAGLTLPALPSSAPWCTLGGMVANNAAGARSLRWGATRSWTRGLRWTEADGSEHSVARGTSRPPCPSPRWSGLHAQLWNRFADGLPWPRVAKNSSGYAIDLWMESRDPVDLLVGSEGTLAVVTEVTLDLHPADAVRRVAVAGLPERSALREGALLAAATGANAAEYFGSALVRLGGLGDDARLTTLRCDEGLLLVEYGGEPDEVEDRMGAFRRWATATGGVVEAESASASAALWALRHDASPRIMREVGGGRRSIQFIEDSVVPLPHLDEYVRRLEAILDDAGLPAVIFGHAGQGNLHVNPLVDPTAPGWRSGVARVLGEVVDLIAELGGTLAGEHGDGRLRAPFLSRIFAPEVVEAFGTVKNAFDPRGILNPGVVLPLPESDPLRGLGDAPDFMQGSQGPEAGHR